MDTHLPSGILSKGRPLHLLLTPSYYTVWKLKDFFSYLTYSWARGAHFWNFFVRTSWRIHILYSFSWGFQNCNFFKNRIMPIDAQAWPALPAQLCWPGRLGQAWASRGFVWSKNRNGFHYQGWKTKLLRIRQQNPWCSGHPKWIMILIRNKIRVVLTFLVISLTQS